MAGAGVGPVLLADGSTFPRRTWRPHPCRSTVSSATRLSWPRWVWQFPQVRWATTSRPPRHRRKRLRRQQRSQCPKHLRSQRPRPLRSQCRARLRSRLRRPLRSRRPKCPRRAPRKARRRRRLRHRRRVLPRRRPRALRRRRPRAHPRLLRRRPRKPRRRRPPRLLRSPFPPSRRHRREWTTASGSYSPAGGRPGTFFGRTG
jgi:hypothetical protein